VEEGLAGFRTTTGFRRDFPSRFLEPVPLSELVTRPTSRLVCRADGHAPATVLGTAARLLTGTGGEWTSQRDCWLDVGPAGVSKATGVAVVADALGVPFADVLAIGDGDNDLELFRRVGRSVAMGQASCAVRATATYVTGSVHDDGAAAALNRWFG